jgi:hypothetical protein
MDSPSLQKAILPKQVKQTFNILLHQALDEEQEHPPGTHHAAIAASPISCPNKTSNTAEAWEPTFSSISTSQKPPEPAPGQPIRVKFTRKRNPEARAMTQKPISDSMEVHRNLVLKLKAWKSHSDTEAEDVDDELTHRRSKGSKKGKEQRIKMLGEVNLRLKPKQT